MTRGEAIEAAARALLANETDENRAPYAGVHLRASLAAALALPNDAPSESGRERDEALVRAGWNDSAVMRTLAQHIAAVDREHPRGPSLASFFDAKMAWSRETFGPLDRYSGICAHIRKELDEIEAKPSDLEEWIDVALLAMDGAWRSAGADGAAFWSAMLAKDAKNRARTWPDWRTLSAGSVSEHVRAPHAATIDEGLREWAIGLLGAPMPMDLELPPDATMRDLFPAWVDRYIASVGPPQKCPAHEGWVAPSTLVAVAEAVRGAIAKEVSTTEDQLRKARRQQAAAEMQVIAKFIAMHLDTNALIARVLAETGS